MITIKRATVLAAALGSLFAATAQAQAQHAGYESRREVGQENRIERGIRSGELTHREAAELRFFQSRIDRMEWRAMRDGVLTGHERARIDQARDALGREIYQMKHNAEVAYARPVSGWQGYREPRFERYESPRDEWRSYGRY